MHRKKAQKSTEVLADKEPDWHILDLRFGNHEIAISEEFQKSLCPSNSDAI